MVGYLVNITTAEENVFVLSLTPAPWTPTPTPTDNDGWIGATDQDVEGNWIWVDGPEGGMVFWIGDATGSLVAPFTYENWGRRPPVGMGDGNEPNDQGGEDYAHLQGFFGWNDLPNIDKTPRQGYFVEYGSNFVPIPEPSTLALFATGLAGLAFFGWRRRSRQRTHAALTL
jgi:hypothetical protein